MSVFVRLTLLLSYAGAHSTDLRQMPADSATEEAQSAAQKCFTQVKQIILLVCYHKYRTVNVRR